MGLSRISSNIEIQKRAAEIAAQRAAIQKGAIGTPASSVSATPKGVEGTPAASGSYQIQSGELVNQNSYQINVAEIARRNAEGTKSADPLTGAVAASGNVQPQQITQQYQLPRVDANAVLAQRAAYNVATPNAVKYVSQVASSPYQQTVKNYPNMDIYNQLAKYSIKA